MHPYRQTELMGTVFIILLASTSTHRGGIQHVLTDTIHEIDEAVSALQQDAIPVNDVCLAYCLAGYDLCPSLFGLSHDIFIAILLQFRHYLYLFAPCCEVCFHNIEIFVSVWVQIVGNCSLHCIKHLIGWKKANVKWSPVLMHRVKVEAWRWETRARDLPRTWIVVKSKGSIVQIPDLTGSLARKFARWHSRASCAGEQTKNSIRHG